MFAGQGSQYYQMGQEFYEGEPVFRQFMERADLVVRDLINESLIEVIYRQRTNRFEAFHRLLHTHPAILIFECALAEMLFSRGLRPDYLLGYSLGEYASLVVSGAISFEDALKTVIKQAELTEYGAPPGQMLAILDSPELVDRHPDEFGEWVIAAYNSPRNFVVTASTASVETRMRLQEFLRVRGTLFVELPVDYPFHSPHIDVLRTISEVIFDQVAFSSPGIPIITAEEGCFLKQPSAKHLWDVTRDPVDFAKTIGWLEVSGPYLYVDLGPSGSMANAVKYNLQKNSQSELVTLSSPFGQEGKNLGILLEKAASTLRSS